MTFSRGSSRLQPKPWSARWRRGRRRSCSSAGSAQRRVPPLPSLPFPSLPAVPLQYFQPSHHSHSSHPSLGSLPCLYSHPFHPSNSSHLSLPSLHSLPSFFPSHAPIRSLARALPSLLTVRLCLWTPPRPYCHALPSFPPCLAILLHAYLFARPTSLALPLGSRCSKYWTHQEGREGEVGRGVYVTLPVLDALSFRRREWKLGLNGALKEAFLFFHVVPHHPLACRWRGGGGMASNQTRDRVALRKQPCNHIRHRWVFAVPGGGWYGRWVVGCAVGMVVVLHS